MKKVILKKNCDKKVKRGYLWIFSNQVDKVESNPENGDIVEIFNSNNQFIGKGFYNKNSLISLRLLTYTDEEINKNFLTNKILTADNLRQKLYNDNIYRMVYSESDILPGLIIDRFDNVFSIQINSIGMEKLLPLITEILIENFSPECIIEKNESPLRTLEGLELKTSILYGEYKSKELIIDGIKYNIDLLSGQKSGFFLDQRINRLNIKKYVKGLKVLDCFCNQGGFALNAAIAGAKEVIGIDISKTAIEKCKTNSVINGFEKICRFEVADVFDYLQRLIDENNYFDVIIMDPPSFTKSKKNIPTAKQAYKKVNYLGLQLIKNEGYLITSSCSHHIDENTFIDIIDESAIKAKSHIKLLEFHSASPDHPILLNMPETKYLKFAILYVKK
ncbi:MAG TPA: class I SAM-dependent rRNA methyltransferase [Bacteroidota bacterium]|nr:class I SAM-dependent rRNA methyltransferase [Bacteroidota bacterium]